MEFDEVIKNRRSIRSYVNKPVPKELLLKILEAGTWAPSACNRQLWKFIVIEKEFFNQRLRDVCGSIADIDPPVVIFILYDSRFNPEHHANAQSAACAAQNMMLTAYNEGLGSLMLAGYGDERKIKERLNIPGAYEIMSAIAIGYPNEYNSVPARRPLESVISFNGFPHNDTFPYKWKPKYWTYDQIRNFVEYAIRAKSPSPTFYRPYIFNEFKNEVNCVPKLAGKTLFLGPFAGNYMFRLIELDKVDEVFAACYADEIITFLKDKKRNMNIKTNISFHPLPNQELPFEDNLFDNIFCAHQLERFFKPQDLADELYRVLKPNGRLIFLYSNALSLYYIGWRLMRFRKHGPGVRGPFKPLSPWTIKRLLSTSISSNEKVSKFEIISRCGIMLLPFTKYDDVVLSGPLKYLCKTIFTEYKKLEY